MSVGAASFRSVGIIGPSSMPATGFRVIRGEVAGDTLSMAGIPLPRMVTDAWPDCMVFILSETGSRGSSQSCARFIHPNALLVLRRVWANAEPNRARCRQERQGRPRPDPRPANQHEGHRAPEHRKGERDEGEDGNPFRAWCSWSVSVGSNAVPVAALVELPWLGGAQPFAPAHVVAGGRDGGRKL